MIKFLLTPFWVCSQLLCFPFHSSSSKVILMIFSPIYWKIYQCGLRKKKDMDNYQSNFSKFSPFYRFILDRLESSTDDRYYFFTDYLVYHFTRYFAWCDVNKVAQVTPYSGNDSSNHADFWCYCRWSYISEGFFFVVCSFHW